MGAFVVFNDQFLITLFINTFFNSQKGDGVILLCDTTAALNLSEH
jgi:hypothetical protein